MKRHILLIAALLMAAITAFGQGRTPKDTVLFDKSFLDAGTNPAEKTEFHLVPKYYKA